MKIKLEFNLRALPPGTLRVTTSGRNVYAHTAMEKKILLGEIAEDQLEGTLLAAVEESARALLPDLVVFAPLDAKYQPPVIPGVWAYGRDAKEGPHYLKEFDVNKKASARLHDIGQPPLGNLGDALVVGKQNYKIMGIEAQKKHEEWFWVTDLRQAPPAPAAAVAPVVSKPAPEAAKPPPQTPAASKPAPAAAKPPTSAPGVGKAVPDKK